MKQQIAILGLGTMGMGMAKNLLKAGFPVTVYNRTRAKAEPLASEGARIANTPAEAALGADIVIAMLADDEASREAWTGTNGALSTMKPGSIAIDCGTLTPQWITELNSAAETGHIRLLDAPVTGSKPQAEAGQLTFLVGGQASVLDEARPVLQAMSQAILHLGPVGSGARMKLINNFLCGVQLASLAEAMVWIERSGLNQNQALGFLKKAAPGSPLLSGLSARMVERTYNVNFLLPLMQKDMQYAQADAKTMGVNLRTASVAETRLQDAIQAGFSDKDMSAIVEPVREAGKRDKNLQTESANDAVKPATSQ